MRGIRPALGLLFRELLGENLLLFFALLLLSLFPGLLLLKAMVPGGGARVVQHGILFALEFFPLLFLLVYGAAMLSRQRERGNLSLLFTRPLKRGEWLAAHWLTLMGVLLSLELTVSLSASLFLRLFVGEAWLLPLGQHLFFTLLRAGVLTSLALLLSATLSPSIASTLFLLLSLIGQLFRSGLEASASGGGVLGGVIKGLSLLLPDLSLFDRKTELLYGLPLPREVYFSTALYALFYGGFLLFLASLLFHRREL